MMQLKLVDAFPEFLRFWESVRHLPLETQITRWRDDYMADWPAVQQLLIEGYTSMGEDWRAIAREHVFPHLSARLPAMRSAHANLLTILPEVYAQLQSRLDFSAPLTCIIYVGIGYGAGSVDTLEGQTVVMFGLENIAECGWESETALRGLIAHELGHFVHAQWRAEAGLCTLDARDDAWWTLYTEGFAQVCEHAVFGRDTWHMASGAAGSSYLPPDWLAWCRANRGWLAAEFMRCAEAGEDKRPFFGSWYNIRGYSQCGYFLGHEVVRAALAESSLRDIALWDAAPAEDAIVTRMRYYLRQFIQQQPKGEDDG